MYWLHVLALVQGRSRLIVFEPPAQMDSILKEAIFYHLRIDKSSVLFALVRTPKTIIVYI